MIAEIVESLIAVLLKKQSYLLLESYLLKEDVNEIYQLSMIAESFIA